MALYKKVSGVAGINWRIFMSIKFMIKLCWIGSIILFIAISGLTFFILNSNDQQPQNEEKENDEALNYQANMRNEDFSKNYSFVNSARITIDRPRLQQPQASFNPKDRYLSSLKSEIKEVHIFSVGFARIRKNNSRQDILLETWDEKKESPKIPSAKPWEVIAGGSKFRVIEIDPQKGILFQHTDTGIEVWLEPTEEEKLLNSNSENFGTNNNNPYEHTVTTMEGRAMINNMSDYISELAPEVSNKGICLRRVSEGSKASSLGFKEGDIIQSVNGSPTNSFSTSAIEKLIRQHNGKPVIKVKVLRNNMPITLSFNISSN